MGREVFLTEEAIAEMEDGWRLRKDAVRLLDLVVAEWETDPQSVACFDLRIIEEANQVIRKLKAIEKKHPSL